MLSTVIAGAIGVAVFCGTLVVLYIVRACAAVLIWSWLLAPALGLPPLTIPVAIGLTLFTAVVHPHPYRKTPKAEQASTLEQFGYYIFGPVFILSMAWIVSLIAG